MELVVNKVLGRTGSEEKVAKFSIWMIDNLERLEDSNQDLLEETGTYEIGYQKEIDKLVVQVNTLQDDLAEELQAKLKEIGFEETEIFRIGL